MSHTRRGSAADREGAPHSSSDVENLKGSSLKNGDDHTLWMPVSSSKLHESVPPLLDSRFKKSPDGEDVKISAKADEKCDVISMNSASTKRKRGPYKSEGDDVKISAKADAKCDVISMNSTSTERKRGVYKSDGDDVKIGVKADEKCDVISMNSASTKRKRGAYKSDGEDLKISAKADAKCDVISMNSTSTERKRGVYKSDGDDVMIGAKADEKCDVISMNSASTKRKRGAYKSDGEDLKISVKADAECNANVISMNSTSTKRKRGVYKSEGEDLKISAEADAKCGVSSMNSTPNKRKRGVYKSDGEDLKISAEADAKCDVNVISMNSSNESADDETKTCSICLEIPEESECAKLDGCAHLFCFGCIDKWSQRENTCPLCKVRFHKIERLLKTDAKAKKRKDGGSSKKIKNRDQSADLFDHNSIQGLFASLHASGALPPQLAEALFSARGLFQGNPFATTRGSSRNGNNGGASNTSDSATPVVVSVRQTSYVQRRTPVSGRERSEMPFFHFFHPPESDDDDDDDGVGFFPAVIARTFRFEVDPRSSTSTAASASSSRTVDLSSSPQRSYVVRGQGSAQRPLEIGDSDEE